ncbi:MAG: hypothetical protein ACI4HI_10560 [Lachnospiraceae bacterium]
MGELNEYKNILSISAKLKQEVPEIFEMYKETKTMQQLLISEQKNNKEEFEREKNEITEIQKDVTIKIKKIEKLLGQMEEIEHRLDEKLERLEEVKQIDGVRNELSKIKEQMENLTTLKGSSNWQEDMKMIDYADFEIKHTIGLLYSKYNKLLKGPLIVKSTSWRGDFCFAVYGISKEKAIGLWFKNGIAQSRSNGKEYVEDLKNAYFVIYKGPSLAKIADTFDSLKEEHKLENVLMERLAGESRNNDGFMGIPDHLEDELPFL